MGQEIRIKSWHVWQKHGAAYWIYERLNEKWVKHTPVLWYVVRHHHLTLSVCTIESALCLLYIARSHCWSWSVWTIHELRVEDFIQVISFCILEWVAGCKLHKLQFLLVADTSQASTENSSPFFYSRGNKLWCEDSILQNFALLCRVINYDDTLKALNLIACWSWGIESINDSKKRNCS